MWHNSSGFNLSFMLSMCYFDKLLGDWLTNLMNNFNSLGSSLFI